MSMDNQETDKLLRSLIDRCKEISMGKYSNLDGVFDLLKTGSHPELIGELAESFGMMTRKLQAREFHLQQTIEKLEQDFAKLEITLEGTALSLMTVIEKRDPYTAGHGRGVTKLVCAIAKEMGFSDWQIEGIRVAGFLHDIGKIAVPAEILSKAGYINKYEFNIIKTHPQVGYDILKAIEFPWPIAQIVLQHHERMDGSGYPHGISGGEILLEARMMAVADLVEAMASRRPYRLALGIDKALEEISKNRGVIYDADVVDACLRLFQTKGFSFD